MVKEGESGISPIQIHVTDKDTQNSPAWSVKYMLHGEISAFFQVDTDPATNDGILTLVKVGVVIPHFRHSRVVVTVSSDSGLKVCFCSRACLSHNYSKYTLLSYD